MALTGVPVPGGPEEAETTPALEHRAPQTAETMPSPAYRESRPGEAPPAGEVPEHGVPQTAPGPEAARKDQEEKTRPAQGDRPFANRQPAGPGDVREKAAEGPGQTESAAGAEAAKGPEQRSAVPPARRGDSSRAGREGAPNRTQAPEGTESPAAQAAEGPESLTGARLALTGVPVPGGPGEAETTPALEYREPQSGEAMPSPAYRESRTGEAPPAGAVPKPGMPQTAPGPEAARKDQEEKTRPAQGDRPFANRQPAGPGDVREKAAEGPGQTESAAGAEAAKGPEQRSAVPPARRGDSSRAGREGAPNRTQAPEGTESPAAQAAEGPESLTGVRLALTGVPVPGGPEPAEAGFTLEYREPQPGKIPPVGEVPAPDASQAIPRQEDAEVRRRRARSPAEGRSGQAEASRAEGPVADGLPISGIPGDDRVELTYVQPPGETRQESAAAAQAETPSGRIEPFGQQDLPDWARELFRGTEAVPDGWSSGSESFRYDAGQNQAGAAGASAPGGSASPPAGGGKQIVWSAPGAHFSPAAAAPSPSVQMVFRDRENGMDPASLRDRGMEERELRKTADRVYRLIEERLRRELRRNGK